MRAIVSSQTATFACRPSRGHLCFASRRINPRWVTQRMDCGQSFASSRCAFQTGATIVRQDLFAFAIIRQAVTHLPVPDKYLPATDFWRPYSGLSFLQTAHCHPSNCKFSAFRKATNYLGIYPCPASRNSYCSCCTTPCIHSYIPVLINEGICVKSSSAWMQNPHCCSGPITT